MEAPAIYALRLGCGGSCGVCATGLGLFWGESAVFSRFGDGRRQAAERSGLSPGWNAAFPPMITVRVCVRRLVGFERGPA